MSKLSFSVIIKEICKLVGCRTSQLQKSITTIHRTSASLKACVLSTCRQQHTRDRHIRGDGRWRSVTDWFHSLRDWNSALQHRSQVWARLPVVFSCRLSLELQWPTAYKLTVTTYQLTNIKEIWSILTAVQQYVGVTGSWSVSKSGTFNLSVGKYM